LRHATAHTPTVLATARHLLEQARPIIEERGLTLIGLAIANLRDDIPIQLALPFRSSTSSALDRTLDELHERFGKGSVTRAVLLGRDPGITMPHLPD
jgi:DNA polymerase-4